MDIPAVEHLLNEYRAKLRSLDLKTYTIPAFPVFVRLTDEAIPVDHGLGTKLGNSPMQVNVKELENLSRWLDAYASLVFTTKKKHYDEWRLCRELVEKLEIEKNRLLVEDAKLVNTTKP